jgi:ZIP family zinc transporter
MPGLPPQLAAPSRSFLMRSGVLIAVGIAIHNFPEGMVTFFSATTGDVAFGIMIAVAIAIHNIPEGIAVSVPIFYATGNRRKAFTYSFLSGVAEPVGALIGYGILFPFLTPTLLSSMLAFVAGIMVFISLDEILPLAHRYGKEHLVLIGIATGMLVMALSLFLLR